MIGYKWSEIFSSIEGEGPYTGWSTVYIRFTHCNFECRNFNNPEGVKITNQVLGFDPKNFTRLEDIPPITKGCDSIYSWDPRFSHLWKGGDASLLAKEVIKIVPHNSWSNPNNGRPVILSLTGGEPTLHAKRIPELLDQPEFKELQYILFETNCSVPLQWDFLIALNEWAYTTNFERRIIWSNSPKLSVSGESWDKAIKPEIARKQRTVHHSEQYFKFVASDSDRDFDEVARAMEAYHSEGIPTSASVYIMPVSCIESQQLEIAERVARKCIERGYIYCHRVQLSVFRDQIGT